jgi:hypothetical protein
MVLSAHALQGVKVGLNSVNNQRQITTEAEKILRTSDPRLAVGTLSNATLYSLRMRYEQCKLG